MNSPVARSNFLNWAISEPLSRVKVCRRPDGISHKRGTSASPEAAAVLLWALASSRKRPLRSLQLSSVALPLEAQTRLTHSPKAIPLGSRLRSLADVSKPGKQAAAPGSYPLCRLLRRSPMSATQLAAYGLHADVHAFILRPVQAHTACNLFGRAVAARLLIYPGNLFGLAHAAEMARHRSSFPGTVISSPGTIAGFGVVAVHSRDHTHGHKYFAILMRSSRVRWLWDMADSFWLLGCCYCQVRQNPALALYLFMPIPCGAFGMRISPPSRWNTDTRGHNGSLQPLRKLTFP